MLISVLNLNMMRLQFLSYHVLSSIYRLVLEFIGDISTEISVSRGGDRFALT